MERHRHHISKNFVYFLAKQRDGEPKQDDSQPDQHKLSNVLDKLLLAVGREALRETAPSLQALEQILQDILVPDSEQITKKIISITAKCCNLVRVLR